MMCIRSFQFTCLFLFVFGLISCTKDQDVFDSYITPDVTPTGDVSAFLKEISEIRVPKFSYNIDAQAPITLTYSNKLFVSIPEQAWVDANGNSVTGNIEVKMLYAESVSEFLTLGINGRVGTNQLMKLGGACQIQAFQQGAPLQLKQDAQLIIQCVNNNISGQLPVFYSSDNALNKSWTQQSTGNSSLDFSVPANWNVNGVDYVGTKFQLASTGWAGFGSTFQVTNPTNRCVTLPEGYRSVNTMVFGYLQGPGIPFIFLSSKFDNQFCLEIFPDGEIADAFVVTSVEPGKNAYQYLKKSLLQDKDAPNLMKPENLSKFDIISNIEQIGK